VILSHAPSCSCKSNKKRKEKKRKRNINNDLAVLPSHDSHSLEIAVLVVLSLGSMISCSIRTVPTATIKRGALELAVSTQP